MVDFPVGLASGALAFLFVQKLAQRLELEGKLPPDDSGRIWAEIATELEPQKGTARYAQCLGEIGRLKLAKP